MGHKYVQQNYMSGSAQLLNDLNTLIQTVKKREELHLQLVNYIKRVINSQNQQNIFVQEELQAHRTFAADLVGKDTRMREEQEESFEKYDSRSKFDEADQKLISRCILRILEICQALVGKLKHHFNYYEQPHTEFHQNITKILQNQKISVLEVVKPILAYSRGKLDEDLECLNKMIDLIERGERILVPRVTQEREEKRLMEIQTRKAEQERKRKQIMIERELQHKKQKEKIAQRMLRIKQEAKIQEKARKQTQKFIDKVYTKIYSVLEPDKQLLVEGMIYSCKQQEQFKKLYTQILEKNQFNLQQISNFCSKADDFKEKVRKFKESMVLSPLRKSRGRMYNMSTDCKSDSMQVYSSTDCLTTASNSNKKGEFQESPTTAVRGVVPDALNTQRGSVGSMPPSERKQTSPNHRLPNINPFLQRRKNQRYDSSNLSQTRRQSQMGKSEAANLSSKADSRVMQVPQIHLNMVEKFEFKVHQQLPRKRQSVSKAFQYTFYFRKRQTARLNQTRYNFML